MVRYRPNPCRRLGLIPPEDESLHVDRDGHEYANGAGDWLEPEPNGRDQAGTRPPRSGTGYPSRTDYPGGTAPKDDPYTEAEAGGGTDQPPTSSAAGPETVDTQAGMGLVALVVSLIFGALLTRTLGD